MKKILDGKADKQIIDASPVELGLVKRTVCSVSGKLATEACMFDASGHVPITDWFAGDSVPLKAAICMCLQTYALLPARLQAYIARRRVLTTKA